jgi:hypothetical protein
MVKNEEETLLLPVALAEELPARETAELVARVQGEIGVPVDRVVVNAVSDPPFPPGVPDLDARLARARLATSVPGLPRAETLAACAAHLRERHALHAAYVERIGAWTGLPTVCLPLLPGGVEGPDDLERLAERLVGAAP